jgi:alanyl-tRNA synthetase
MERDYKILIENAEKRYFRAGNILKTIFSNPEKFLSAEDCMLLLNSYGVDVSLVVVLALWQGFEYDAEGFQNLLEQQMREYKNMKECLRIEC